MGVIKADGYGHGAVEVASILKEKGISRLPWTYRRRVLS